MSSYYFLDYLHRIQSLVEEITDDIVFMLRCKPISYELFCLEVDYDLIYIPKKESVCPKLSLSIYQRSSQFSAR